MFLNGMLRSNLFIIALVGIFYSALLPTYALAQADDQSEGLIKLPTSSREFFPKLPESNFCSKEKIVGLWKLIMLYEVPSGREMAVYSKSPLQYYVFEPDNRYGEYVSVLHNISLENVREAALRKNTAQSQFSVNKSGMIFFYKNSIAIDSLACFIVDKYSPPFMAGQMLLMPPESAAAGKRLLKIYEKVYIGFE